MEGYQEFQGGGGFKRKFFFKESMMLNWNFQRGFQLNNLPWGMAIFWNNTVTKIVSATSL